MKRFLLNCLPYNIITLLVLCIALAIYLYYAVGCTRTTELALSSSVKVIIKRHTDKPAGEFISRSIDVIVEGKRLRRIWCSPMPSPTGVTGIFIALCKGDTTQYVAVRDQAAFWILRLDEPAEVRVTFSEKSPPKIEAEYNVTDPGEVIPMPAQFSNWMEYASHPRNLLEGQH